MISHMVEQTCRGPSHLLSSDPTTCNNLELLRGHVRLHDRPHREADEGKQVAHRQAPHPLYALGLDAQNGHLGAFDESLALVAGCPPRLFLFLFDAFYTSRRTRATDLYVCGLQK